MKARTSLSLLLGGVLAVGSGFVSAVAVADGDVQPANVEAQPGPLDTCCTPSGADMPTVGGNLGNQHYSALTQIKRQNLHKLGPVWRTHVSAVEPATDDVGQQTTPIVADGVIYLDTPNGEVIAVDGKTGQANWKWAPDGLRHERHAARRVRRGRQGLHAR